MFTDREKTRIKHFLGYPDWQNLSNGIQMGYPAGSQPLFLVEQSFNRMTPEAEESVRRDLCECEACEAQLGDSRSRLKAESLGNIKLNPAERAALRDELRFWTKRLADDLGVMQNPYSTMANEGGGINARVL